MNDQSEQDRADAEREHDTSEETSPESPQTAEQEDRVLQQQEAAGGPRKKSKMPPSRIVFLVFVVIAAVAIGVELRARRNYTRTIEVLDQALEKGEKDGSAIYRKDLGTLVRGSPSRQYDEQTQTETFTWRGIRPHRLEVQYGRMEFVSGFRTP
jgi:hypothetical protein